MKIVSIMAFYLFLITSTNAASINCLNPKNNSANNFCVQKIFVAADKEINEEYAKLTTFLSKKEKKTLKLAELSWIKKKNTECGLDKSDGNYADTQCAADLTIKRTNFLRDRLRECATIGCLAYKLKYVSFNEVEYVNKPRMGISGNLIGPIYAGDEDVKLTIDERCYKGCSGWGGFFAQKRTGLNEIRAIIFQGDKPIMKFVAVRDTPQQNQFGINIIFSSSDYNISVSVTDEHTGKALFSSTRQFKW